MGINDYKFPIMITNSREVYCKELKNIHYKNILKYIQNNDDDNLCKYFELLINDLCETDESLNYIDKFLILIAIRMVCINNILEIETPSKIKNTLNIGDMSKTIIENFSPNTRTINCQKDIKVEIGYPNIISNRDIIFNKIHSIEVSNEKVMFGNLSEKEKDEILSVLPASLSKDTFKEIKKSEIYKEIKLFSYYYEEGEKTDFYFSFDSTKNFQLLKSLYTENLNNIYYYEYIYITKLHMSLSDFLFNMTPVETVLQVTTLSKEIQEQNKSKSAATNKNQSPTPGLGSPR